MKKAIGFLVWLVLRAYTLVTRTRSVTFYTPQGESLFYIGPRHGRGWGFLQDDGTVKRAHHNDGNTGQITKRDDEAVRV